MARVEVLLPQWGMGMSEGTITTWHKAVGDTVAEDEPLAEVEAEKVEETLESPATGTIVEILVPEGDTVEVRTRRRGHRDRPDGRAATAPSAAHQEEHIMVRPELTGARSTSSSSGPGSTGSASPRTPRCAACGSRCWSRTTCAAACPPGPAGWSTAACATSSSTTSPWCTSRCRERERLFRLAPHLVKPVPLMMPIYAHNRRPGVDGRAGHGAYDALSLRQEDRPPRDPRPGGHHGPLHRHRHRRPVRLGGVLRRSGRGRRTAVRRARRRGRGRRRGHRAPRSASTSR